MPLFGRVVAWLLALGSLAALMIGPITAYRLWVGIPLSGTGPSWEIWLLIVGGAAGSGLGRFAHHLILTKWFNVGEGAEEELWRGR